MYHDVVSFVHELYGTEGMVPLHVPTFRGNEKKYLNECIDSILAQTFTDFEVILVDDGSPDNCPAMCDAAAQREKFNELIDLFGKVGR